MRDVLYQIEWCIDDLLADTSWCKKHLVPGETAMLAGVAEWARIMRIAERKQIDVTSE